jgi:hypothetical protein
MIIEIPLFQGLALKISDAPSSMKGFPTARLQKGLILLDHDQELDEEGVGFGVPVLKRGLHTIFPGAVRLTCLQNGSIWEIIARYELNLVEKIQKGKNDFVENRLVYLFKNLLAAMIRQVPGLRSPLTTTSSKVREMLDWETTYVRSDFSQGMEVIYRVDGEKGSLTVEMNTGNLPPEITEVVVMNEQGARPFERYSDSSGIELQGDEIGCWDEVNAEKAWFESISHKTAFRLGPIIGVRLFRGRELVGSRLAWAGFGYSFPPSSQNIKYEICIDRIP